MNSYQCGSCFFPYHEQQGLPEHDIAAGTRWDEVPADFACPECGTPKAGFIAYRPDQAP